MAKKLYELTPEHRARLPEWRDRWIDIICSTQAMTEEERAGCREAVPGLHAAANLPPPKRVVFAPSPIVLAVAGGFAAAIWGQWVSYLTFFRHVAQLDIDYEKFAHYEYLAEHSGPRVMTPDFCMISDRPAVLLRDEQNRPHCNDGPFCRWRDGFSLYAIHGVRVPEWLVMRPDMLTVERIHAEQNEEVRRVMIERYGIARYVRDAQFEVVDADVDPLGQPRRLLRRDSTLVVELTNSTVDADGTRRVYHIPVEPELRPLLPDGQLGAPQKLTALNAVASTFGMRGDEYRLEVET